MAMFAFLHSRKAGASTLCLTTLLAGSLLIATGCHLSPRVMQRTHLDYSEVIRQTRSEQMLLNIVRIRYDEMPLFLDVASISTQFSVQQGVGVSGSISENVGPTNIPSVLGLSGSAAYAESPVVTWSIPESREFLGRLMAPMGTDQLTVLAQSGWGDKRVFRFGVKKMNRVRNIDFQENSGTYEPRTYDRFIEALDLLSELRREDVIDFTYGGYMMRVAHPLPLEQLDSRTIPPAVENGIFFLGWQNHPGQVEPARLEKPLVVRFSKGSDGDPRVRRLRELLNLAPDRYTFGIVDTAASSAELISSAYGEVTTAFNPDATFEDISVYNRSVMEILYFASNSVEPPQDHLDRGWTYSSTEAGLGDLKIHSSWKEPSNAWLKVRHKGYWFYIAGDDNPSRNDFNLIEALFAANIGSVPGGYPVLTLPVK